MKKVNRNLQEEVGKKRAFASREQEAYLNLLRTHQVLTDAFHVLFREHGLTQSQYNVLRIVRGSGKEGIASQSIAEQMVARDPDMTTLVDRLEKAKLVSRRRSRADRRVIRVCLLAKGRRLLAELDGKVMRLHRAQLGHMSGERLSRLSELLVEARYPSEVE